MTVDVFFNIKGREGIRQISMTFRSRATHVPQWLRQNDKSFSFLFKLNLTADHKLQLVYVKLDLVVITK